MRVPTRVPVTQFNGGQEMKPIDGMIMIESVKPQLDRLLKWAEDMMDQPLDQREAMLAAEFRVYVANSIRNLNQAHYKLGRMTVPQEAQ